jgi:dolichol-phosphate mannosyltransferase
MRYSPKGIERATIPAERGATGTLAAVSSGPAINGQRPQDHAIVISVVVPVYGCRDCLFELHRRTTAALAQLPGECEIVLVDDGSPDDAWPTIRKLATDDPRVRGLRLSRNFGQHAAITAGLAASRGRWAVVMDCDLQDPPEEIPRLYAKALEGFDVVLSRREERVQSVSRRLAASAYFRLHNMIARGNLHTNYTNLSVISRKVVDSFLALRDHDRQYLLMLHWLGFKRAELDVRQTERHAGRSSYSFRQLVKVAIDGLFFQSTVMLRWIIYVGFFLALLGVALAAYALLAWTTGNHLPSWTALPMFGLFLAAFIIISGGVTGLYVGKIFEQVKGRPLFVVDEIAGGELEPRPSEALRESDPGGGPEAVTPNRPATRASAADPPAGSSSGRTADT